MTVHPILSRFLPLLVATVAWNACIYWLPADPYVVALYLLGCAVGGYYTDRALARALAKPPILILDTVGGQRYLTRWDLIRTRTWRVYVHLLSAPDADRHLHNHPSWWRCVVLSGGYEQDVKRLVLGATGMPTYNFLGRLWTESKPERRVVRWVNTFDRLDYHRIVSVKPNTWTLCFSGAREASWGFLVDGSHVDHTEYLS